MTAFYDSEQSHARLRAVTDARSQPSTRHRWQANYVRRLAISDSVIIIAAVALAQWFRFGGESVGVTSGGVTPNVSGQYSYTAVSLVLVLMWIATLSVFRTRSIRVIGSGPEEYRRIFVSTVRLFGLIAIVSLLLQLDIARLYLAFAFPAGLVALIANRWYWRRVHRPPTCSRRVQNVRTRCR